MTGTASVGATLSTTDGTWANTPSSYTYQWQRAGVNIGSATASTYLLIGADTGSTIRCVVTATNAAGSTPANSNATSAVVQTGKTATFEAGVDGNTITTGAGEASADAWNGVSIGASTTLTYSSTQKAHGSLAGKFTSTSTNNTYLSHTGFSNLTTAYGRFYLYGSAPGSNKMIGIFSSGSGTIASIWWLGTGKLAIYTGAGSVQICQTAASFPTNAMTRVEYRIGFSATVGYGHLKTFNTIDSTTPTEDVGADSGAFNTLSSGTGLQEIQYGYVGGSVSGWTMYFDDIVGGATAGWVGPAA